nr:immunoglobulin light chain junction region [Macaca mulatta]MOW02262.1 immunoglobulin light chain junction region [Macaca mulatta]MOW02277.1 immunoglobulin light chain junction region [Macaca mulatta]MOW02310.1 immunoglobulin light chain junction region [Macaca mulatta]MOW02315.1 immunoglobulin light chain junction region [Macaca mulatta]
DYYCQSADSGDNIF